jgi:hypothetical protein
VKTSKNLSKLICLFTLLSAGATSSAFAVKHGLEERVTYNTEKQLGTSLTGIYSFTEKIYSVLGLQYGRYPTSVPKGHETNYLGSLQVGYNTGLWGLDGSYAQGFSAKSKLMSRTFAGGLTFAYLPGMLENKDRKLDVLKASSRPTYQTELTGEKEPLFWSRAGVTSTNLSSKVLAAGGGIASQAGLRQLSVSFDVYYPINRFSVLSTGAALYGYTKDPAAYSTELFNDGREEAYLIGGTVSGLPAFSYWAEYSWQVTPLDGFIPRFSTSMVSASKQWDIGGSVTWRRRVMPHLYFTPSYELSVLGAFVVSGINLSIFHDF